MLLASPQPGTAVLADLGECQSELEGVLARRVRLVCRAREPGVPWVQIGAVVGMKKTTARAHFAQRLEHASLSDPGDVGAFRGLTTTHGGTRDQQRL